MELTEVKFWDEYWANCNLPNKVDFTFAFERCLALNLKTLLANCSGDILEIGCAPGKWLAFLSEELGLTPSGIEYSSAGMLATKKNFEMLNLSCGEIWSGDFFQLPPVKEFNVVMSLGFIEHFSNVDEVIERHLQWLKPGGTLVLGVPNFRGIYRTIQTILDKTVLEKHNLDIMTPEYFEKIASRYGLEMVSAGYLGSFEPSLPIAQKGPSSFQQLIVKAFIRITKAIRERVIFDNLNNPFISSYILAVYKKGPSS